MQNWGYLPVDLEGWDYVTRKMPCLETTPPPPAQPQSQNRSVQNINMQNGESIREFPNPVQQLSTGFLTTVSLPGDGISFNGIDGLKSAEFLHAIRLKTYNEGRLDDSTYRAILASMCFAGPALVWFENLDEDVQTDWTLLRRLFLKRFPAGDGVQGHIFFFSKLVGF